MDVATAAQLTANNQAVRVLYSSAAELTAAAEALGVPLAVTQGVRYCYSLPSLAPLQHCQVSGLAHVLSRAGLLLAVKGQGSHCGLTPHCAALSDAVLCTVFAKQGDLLTGRTAALTTTAAFTRHCLCVTVLQDYLPDMAYEGVVTAHTRAGVRLYFVHLAYSHALQARHATQAARTDTTALVATA